MEDSRGWRFLDPRLEYQRLDHDTALSRYTEALTVERHCQMGRGSQTGGGSHFDCLPLGLLRIGGSCLCWTETRTGEALKEGCLGTSPAVVDSQANPGLFEDHTV